MPSVNDPNVMGTPEEQEPTKAEALTSEKVNELVNAAIAMRDKRTEKRLAEMLDAKFAALRAPQQDAQEGQEGDSKASQSAEAKELAKLKRQFADEVKLRKDISRKAAEGQARNEVVSALTNSGKVRPDGIQVAADLIIKAHNKLSFDDDGSYAYRIDDDQTVSVSEGINQFLKSQEASLFLAPPRGQNANGRPTRAPQGQVSVEDREAQLRDFVAQLPK